MPQHILLSVCVSVFFVGEPHPRANMGKVVSYIRLGWSQPRLNTFFIPNSQLREEDCSGSTSVLGELGRRNT